MDENINEQYHYRAGLPDFPIILYGNGIKPQRIDTPVSAEQIAPTIARALHTSLPNACTASALR